MGSYHFGIEAKLENGQIVESRGSIDIVNPNFNAVTRYRRDSSLPLEFTLAEDTPLGSIRYDAVAVAAFVVSFYYFCSNLKDYSETQYP